VFSEFAGRGSATRWLVIIGSLTMILGAVAISSAVAPKGVLLDAQGVSEQPDFF
jgi:hypothetical protein